MSNGSVERGVEWVSTHFGGAMGVLTLSWRREVLKKFNTVEACLGGTRGSISLASIWRVQNTRCRESELLHHAEREEANG
ncbi:hypothetical protein P8452_40794 [Trifolium repens]|nr:hypothetical protein P8452_40794 [Trifolium repens]